MCLAINIIQCFLILNIGLNSVLIVNGTLKFVSVLFRHGDRWPSRPLEMYPNDPYLKNISDPSMYGKLTGKGKLREYNMGKVLRNKYDKFLGKIYIPGSVKAQCTNINRTKESLHLVLGALFRNVSIPISFKPEIEDTLFFPQACPKYILEYSKARKMPDVLEEKAQLENFMKNLSAWTGKKIRHVFDMYNIYFTLESEYSMFNKLPPWTIGVFPDGDLLRGTVLEYKIMNYNEEMRSINGGMLLREIIKDMESVINGSISENRRMNLYSAHDLNVVAVLSVLGVYYPHAPRYSSNVMIDLHEIDGIFYIKVSYYLGIPAVIRELTIPGCEVLCPFETFINLMNHVLTSSAPFCNKIRTFPSVVFSINDVRKSLHKTCDMCDIL